MSENNQTNPYISQYKPNKPLNEKKRQFHLILGWCLLGGVILFSIIISLIFFLVLDMNANADENNTLLQIYYATIFFAVLIGISGILFITGKFDKKIYCNSELKEIIQSSCGIDSQYVPGKGINVDECYKLNLNDNEYVYYADYFTAVTDKKVKYEAGFVSSEAEEIMNLKHKQEQQINSLVNQNGTNINQLNFSEGTYVIYRHINEKFDGDLLIVNKNCTISENNKLIEFHDTLNPFFFDYHKVFTDNEEKAKEFITHKLAKQIKTLENYFKKGITFYYKNNNLYIFLHKYRMNLSGIQTDRFIKPKERRNYIIESLDALAYIPYVLKLTGSFKSPFDGIVKVLEKPITQEEKFKKFESMYEIKENLEITNSEETEENNK